MTIPTPESPRIGPIDRADATEVQAGLLEGLGLSSDLHLFRTLVRHPGLFRAWSSFGGRLLLRSALAARDRELVILRAAWLCRSDYEWGQHVAIGRDAGLSDDEIQRVAAAPDHESWSDWDRTLLAATDQLIREHCIDDATWAALAGRYDEQQLLEVTLLAGHYAMLAGMLRSAGVQPETASLPRLGTVA